MFRSLVIYRWRGGYLGIDYPSAWVVQCLVHFVKHADGCPTLVITLCSPVTRHRFIVLHPAYLGRLAREHLVRLFAPMSCLVFCHWQLVFVSRPLFACFLFCFFLLPVSMSDPFLSSLECYLIHFEYSHSIWYDFVSEIVLALYFFVLAGMPYYIVILCVCAQFGI